MRLVIPAPPVIPAKAGIQGLPEGMDPRMREDDARGAEDDARGADACFHCVPSQAWVYRITRTN